jgi:hypothetical protein
MRRRKSSGQNKFAERNRALLGRNLRIGDRAKALTGLTFPEGNRRCSAQPRGGSGVLPKAAAKQRQDDDHCQPRICTPPMRVTDTTGIEHAPHGESTRSRTLEGTNARQTAALVEGHLRDHRRQQTGHRGYATVDKRMATPMPLPCSPFRT